MIIGLTGGIATGKSTVSNMLREEGIPIVDADIVAREVVKPGKEAYKKVVSHFGSGILKEDGTLDREKLGTIVFKKRNERIVLNDIVHPAVRKEMKEQTKELIKEGHEIVVMDIPLLIESDLLHMVDKVILVFVPEKIQIERLCTRDQFSEMEAMQRINAQIPIDKKRKHAHYIIDNTGSLNETRQQVKKIIKNFSK